MKQQITKINSISARSKKHNRSIRRSTLFRKEAGPCLDIDECEANTHKCTRYSTCSNTYGSYECRCDKGYTGDGLSECYDENECEAKTHECAPERSSVHNLDWDKNHNH